MDGALAHLPVLAGSAYVFDRPIRPLPKGREMILVRQLITIELFVVVCVSQKDLRLFVAIDDESAEGP